MNAELHEDPSMGHKKKGSAEMKRYRGEAHGYDSRRPKRKVISRYK